MYLQSIVGGLKVDTLSILKAARNLIEPKGNWTQGASARNILGNSTSPLSDDAVTWCSYGALVKVSNTFGLNDCIVLLDKMVNQTDRFYNRIEGYNDFHT